MFDIGGVLLTHGEDSYRSGMAARLGLEAVPSTYEVLAPAMQRGEIDESEAWRQIFGRRVENDAFDDLFAAAYKVNPKMVAYAAELRSAGIRTPILSNTQASHVRVMRTLGFLEGFDPIFFSNEIGARKPEHAVFEHVLGALDVAPWELVFIDDVAEYVEAAADFGIHAVRHMGDVNETRFTVDSIIDLAEGVS